MKEVAWPKLIKYNKQNYVDKQDKKNISIEARI